MANWNNPTITSTYTNLITEVKDRDLDLVKGLDPDASVTVTNPVTNMIRWRSSINKWEKYNGSSWVPLTATYAIDISGNAGTASAVAWAGITGKPTTVAGYGITDIQSYVFPSGTKLMFPQAAAPTGWTQITTDEADNRMLRVVSTAIHNVGGSHSPILMNVVPTHSHTASTATGGSHSHTFSTGTASANHTHGVSDPGHNHVVRGRYAGGSDNSQELLPAYAVVGYWTFNNIALSRVTGISIAADGWNHFHSGTTATDSGHTHTVTVSNNSGSDWTPRYVDMILCSKN